MADEVGPGPLRFGLVTLFPEFFASPLAASLLGRATQLGMLDVRTWDIRSVATNRARTVDDTPYGGGSGMVLRAPVLAAITTAAREALPGLPVILMSPQGETFRQHHARTLAHIGGAILVCGRYEGVDERFIERYVDVELSLGDFVLTGGEPAAMTIIDAVARLRPGVLGNEHSAVDESFSAPRLEYPQFTRPPVFEGLEVPAVLPSGDHGRVDQWRQRIALARTESRRPDLLVQAPVSAGEQKAMRKVPLTEADAWMWRPRTLDGWVQRQALSGQDPASGEKAGQIQVDEPTD